MLSPLIREALVLLRRRLEARFPGRVRSVCLFGSWARGEATEHSDVDIAVVIDALSVAEWRETLAIAADIQRPDVRVQVEAERSSRLKSSGRAPSSPTRKRRSRVLRKATWTGDLPLR